MKKYFAFLLFLLVIFGIFIRLYNLNWGSPFYFHPDERNIASAITQLSFPKQLNPNFFAYGTVPIYVIFFSGLIINLFKKTSITFEQAIILSRLFSFILSVLLIPSVYVLAKKINPKSKFWAVFLTTTCVGLIQFSHFGTFEMWLTFFSVWLLYFCLKILKELTISNMVIAGMITGILIGIKVSSIVLLGLPVISIIISLHNHHTYFKSLNFNLRIIKVKILIPNLIYFINLLKFFPLYFIITGLIYILTNPFVFLDPISFKNSMTYESSVALGSLPVFYTGSFLKTIPILFQFTFVYPFLLNPFLSVMFIPSFIYISIRAIQTKNKTYLLLIAFYILLFFSQAFLFVKWIRYMVPTLPFMIIILGIALSDFLGNIKKKIMSQSISFSIIFICIIYAVSYFLSTYFNNYTAVTASNFANKNIPYNAAVLSEVYDLGIIPFNQYFHHIDLSNTYDLDNGDPTIKNNLEQSLVTHEYIILPSQRVIRSRVLNKNNFPNGFIFYAKLFNGSLGFTKIYQTPCSIICKITYMGDPIFHVEETASVFDRPTVFIFKKTRQLSFNEYRRELGN